MALRETERLKLEKGDGTLLGNVTTVNLTIFQYGKSL